MSLTGELRTQSVLDFGRIAHLYGHPVVQADGVTVVYDLHDGPCIATCPSFGVPRLRPIALDLRVLGLGPAQP